VTGLAVLATGPLATIQDLGRPGLAAMGVGLSGAADRPALRLANRLVGNPEGAAVIEATVGGLAVRALRPLQVAVTGAPCPVRVGGRLESVNTMLRLPAGTILRLGVPDRGVRSYLAVRGGIDVAPVLGSRATDTLAGIGPPRLRAGDELTVGPHPPGWPAVDVAPVSGPATGDLELSLVPGPRDDWFHPSAMTRLLTEPHVVTDDADRVGMRLDGPHLPRARDGELLSEGTVPGSLQVPPSGRLTLFLADHPVTGGYPVIAVVRSADVPRAAQARPGQVIRFRRLRGS
jgi:biotin-dependent carboxylase-like uncharacterized protein